VLEAHSLTAMSIGVKHVINIGDYKQPELRDADDVQGRPDVRGIAKNVVFIDHGVFEDGPTETSRDDDWLVSTMSKRNTHEAELAVQIVHYLLAQGYAQTDIVILTPYLGQLCELRRALRHTKVDSWIGECDLEEMQHLVGENVITQLELARPAAAGGVRTSTIDNFQGEEAEIVVATLVRSNPSRQLGFLRKDDAEQRLNVLCTRARSGLVLIGNAECLQAAAHWRELLSLLRESGSVFDGLPLHCQVHGQLGDPSALSTPEQIHRRVRGGAGCGCKCDEILACGHPCPLDCHPFDRAHSKQVCNRLVRTRCRAGLHPIDKKCCDDAPPPCSVKVVQECGKGHFVVRECCGRSASCRVCAVLSQSERLCADALADAARGEVAVLERLARARLRAKLAAAPPASAAAAHSAVVPASPSEDETDDATTGDAPPAAVEDGPLGPELSREEARAALCMVATQFEQRERQIRRELEDALVEQQEKARKDLAAAHDELLASQARDKEALRARRAAAEEELRRMEARMERQRLEAKEAAAQELIAQDAELRVLHAVLAKDLSSIEGALGEAKAARPPPAVVANVRERIEAMVPTRTCVVCMEDRRAILDGVECCGGEAGHFVCDECFSRHAQAQIERQEFDGEVRCPMASAALGPRRCSSDPYPFAVLARHSSARVVDSWSSKRLELREQALARKMETEYEARLEQQIRERLARQSEEAAIESACKHICDKILTLACPRCGAAFVDYDGCHALTCRRQGCGCAFCALCLEDCGEDAHAHLAICESNASKGLYGGGFEEAQRVRRAKAVEEYLKGSPLLRERVLARCESQLRELKMWPL